MNTRDNKLTAKFGLSMPGWSALGPGLLAASWIFAYHRLSQYDASAGARSSLAGVEDFFFSTAESSPNLLLFLAAWLIYQRRGRLAISMLAPPGPVVSAAGLSLVALASLLCIWSHYIDMIRLMIPSMSLMLLGGSIFVGGRAGAASMLLPSLCLVLAFPHPAVALNAVIFPLQLTTAENTAWILQLGGLKVLQLGDLIFVADGKIFQVIESCAGLRSTETLVMAAILYNEVLFRTGRRALLLVLISPAVGIVVNHLRVLSITLSPYSTLASVHTIQGIAMLVVGVLLLAAIDELFGKILPKSYRPDWKPPRRPGPSDLPQPPVWRPATLLALFMVLGITTATLPIWSIDDKWPLPLSSISPKLGGEWKTQSLPLDEQFMGSVGFTEWMHRLYTKDQHKVEVFVGSDNRMEPRMSLISGKNTLPGPGFKLHNLETIRLGAEGFEVERRVLEDKRGPVVAYHWYVGVDGFGTELLRSSLALDRGPWRRPGRALTARVSTRMPRTLSEWDEHEAYLAQAAVELIEELERINGGDKDENF